MPGLTAKRNEKLEGVPTVDIPDGEFNYVLCKVFDTTGKDRTENKLVIRGEEETEFHVDIFDMLESILENIGMSCECLGGGKMRHNAATKDVHIFGLRKCKPWFSCKDGTRSISRLQKYHVVRWMRNSNTPINEPNDSKSRGPCASCYFHRS